MALPDPNAPTPAQNAQPSPLSTDTAPPTLASLADRLAKIEGWIVEAEKFLTDMNNRLNSGGAGNGLSDLERKALADVQAFFGHRQS